MKAAGIAVSILALTGLGACGGQADLTCDEVETYQLAQERPRVTVPDDLDSLESLREMPMPEPSPRPPRPAGSPCLDRPPEVRLTE